MFLSFCIFTPFILKALKCGKLLLQKLAENNDDRHRRSLLAIKKTAEAAKTIIIAIVWPQTVTFCANSRASRKCTPTNARRWGRRARAEKWRASAARCRRDAPPAACSISCRHSRAATHSCCRLVQWSLNTSHHTRRTPRRTHRKQRRTAHRHGCVASPSDWRSSKYRWIRRVRRNLLFSRRTSRPSQAAAFPFGRRPATRRTSDPSRIQCCCRCVQCNQYLCPKYID